ncbi:MAG: hypothetical protein IPG82_09510 [Saprospiraceae bacterium]|nr:hypothetical protein [Saprospiraceae bacterium]
MATTRMRPYFTGSRFVYLLERQGYTNRQRCTEGIQHDGSFIHEYDPEHLHTDAHREWWVSAEGMVDLSMRIS